MGNFKKHGGFGGREGGRGGFNRSGGRGGFGGGRPDFKRGGRDGGRGDMFSAICAACRKQCEVPFRPSGDKPVYCNECFHSHREAPRTEYMRRDERERDTREAPRHFSPAGFAPSAPKFQGDDKRIDDLKKQLETVNAKLDAIMKVIGGSNNAPAPLSAVKQERMKRTATPLKTLIENAVAPVKQADKKENKEKEKTTTKKKPAAKKGKK